jgi:hypothetical protein
VRAAGNPPQRALALEGIHAYPDRHSVRAGDRLVLHVSSSVAYRLRIYRLGVQMDDTAGDVLIEDVGEAPPCPQLIHPGSYLHVAKGLSRMPRALSLECWVRPWRQRGWAGVLSQMNLGVSGGYGLLLSPEGKPAFYLARTGIWDATHVDEAPIVLERERWQHLVATWDGATKQLWVDGRLAGQWGHDDQLHAANAVLRVGACGSRAGQADHFLDADIGMPAVYSRALTADEITRRCSERGGRVASGPGVLACWPLDEELGARVADASAHRRHARIINHATWMIGGPGFRAEVPRFDNYNPRRDSERGHGLRLASDDLYDCGWEAVHKVRIPAVAKPGFYAARFEGTVDGQQVVYPVTFIVRRARHRARAPIVVLAATNTWLAYNAAAFARNRPGLKQVCGTNGMENSAGDPPAFSFYRAHAGGQGTYQVGLRVPWPSAGPYILYGGPTDYSHLMRADRFLHVWLEKAGYDFDVISDLDLHQEPDLLRRYRVMIINGHSEYWSVPMYRGLERYLAGGGSVMCLSGNSLFWRVSFDASGSVMECRKVDAPGDQLPPARRGECWHSQDGWRGGMLRECGYPGWKLIGLETLGWNNQSDARQFGPFLVENPGHFLFRSPAAVGLERGAAFGQAPDGGLPRANGHEVDVRLSTLARLAAGPVPEGARMPEDPPGIELLATGVVPWRLGGAAFDFFFRPIKPSNDQGGEVIYWERPEGGRVFNAGSIGAGWGAWVDPKFQRLLQNVLAHFGVPEPARPGFSG